MENNPYAKLDYCDFVEILEEYKNLHTAELTYENRFLIMQALLWRAGLDKKIALIAPDVAPPFCWLNGQGHICIEKMCKSLIEKEKVFVGEYNVWTINPDWTVVRNTLPYRAKHSVLA
ncbi:MAG: hypothetical protein WCX10_03850 [Bacteroidales bacterium]|nr:hypothetical protein [Candidatus Paceibacterota bacterium]